MFALLYLFLGVFVFGENNDVTRCVHRSSGHPLPGLPYALLRLHTKGANFAHTEILSTLFDATFSIPKPQHIIFANIPTPQSAKLSFNPDDHHHDQYDDAGEHKILDERYDHPGHDHDHPHHDQYDVAGKLGCSDHHSRCEQCRVRGGQANLEKQK